MSASGHENEEHVFASANSLAGQLQRGRGMGFLRALRESPAIIEPLLFDCVTHDPRWDRQLESRSVYYATLLLQLALPLDPFEAYLRMCSENDTEEAGHAEYVVLDTLCALAVRGDVSAIDLVRAYLIYGRHWEEAFETLMEVSSIPLGVDAMSRILDQRFPDDDVLGDELPGVGPALHTRQEPWKSLRQVNPRVERLLSRREKQAEQRQQQQELLQASFARLSPAELLELEIVDNTVYLVARALQQQVTSTDLDRLLSRAQDSDLRQRLVAFRGLQRLAHPAALPVLQAFFASPEARPGSLYGAAVRAIVALPASATLDLARDWFVAPDGRHRHVALQILEAHATVADAERVHAALLPSLERDTWGTNECYMQGSILDILARLPEARFYPMAETVFREAKYARTRVHSARTLIACDRDQFARERALECLWDCEEGVRLLGCSKVGLHGSEASLRLRNMADDPYEDEEVRQAAKKRC